MKHFGGLKFSSGLVFGGKIFTVLDVFTVENNGLFGVTWTVGFSGDPVLAYYWTYFGFINSSSFLLPCHSYTGYSSLPPPPPPLNPFAPYFLSLSGCIKLIYANKP